MFDNINQLKEIFGKIKEKGWIESKQKGLGGGGRTFEDLIGKSEENFELPDFEGIEIKTKRIYSQDKFITLFNYTPESNYINETQRLKDNYGYPDKKNKILKVLNQSIFVDKRVFVGTTHQFMLKIDKVERKIYLCVFDICGDLIEKESYWSFDTIEEKIVRKMNTLALINIDSKVVNGKEYYKYNKICFYTFKGIDTFIDLLSKNVIRISFRVGVFRSGKRFGQVHDHGTSFDIKEEDLEFLFNKYIF